jgi:hypothetical protein
MVLKMSKGETLPLDAKKTGAFGLLNKADTSKR